MKNKNPIIFKNSYNIFAISVFSIFKFNRIIKNYRISNLKNLLFIISIIFLLGVFNDFIELEVSF